MILKIIKMIQNYNAIDKQINQIHRSVTKYGKYVEELHKDVAKLKKESHPPIFTQSQYTDLNDRITIIEGFIDNIERISTELTKDIAN